MKKTYIAPTTETYKIQTQGMLALSVRVSSNDYNDGTLLGHETDGDWDDEEEY